ncbi:MAG: hypothetical protein DI628_01720 [Blastochloris viridis]|uniref:Stress-induced protein n=1 Tax=Blastochloris viridis TaxID=1079 RepID=A0A6N4RDJ1_BLAVI|nr:MAG: hypothetical protein DI628_01720 [Blastochloris viridis]
MANYGNHEQHVKAGQQSHKNSNGQNDDSNRSMKASGRNQNDSDSSRSSSSGSGTRGGTREQHAEAGRQSHKNSK